MIRSFACPQAEKLFHGERNKLSKDIQRVGLRKLLMLSQANTIEEMKFSPSNRLHPLHKNREGQYAVWINKKYRLCFRFKNGNAYDAEIVDYL